MTIFTSFYLRTAKIDRRKKNNENLMVSEFKIIRCFENFANNFRNYSPVRAFAGLAVAGIFISSIFE